MDYQKYTGKTNWSLLVDVRTMVDVGYDDDAAVTMNFVQNAIIADANTKNRLFTLELDSAARERFMGKGFKCANNSLRRYSRHFFKHFELFSGEFQRKHQRIPSRFFTSARLCVFPSANSRRAALSALLSRSDSTTSSRRSCRFLNSASWRRIPSSSAWMPAAMSSVWQNSYLNLLSALRVWVV